MVGPADPPSEMSPETKPDPAPAPLLWGHRGVMDRENTLEGIQAALDAGMDGIEVDLQLLSDSSVVLFHDENLKRLCGRKGRIATQSAADLKELKLSNGLSIPRVEELFRQWKPQFWLNLELKAGGERLIEQLLPRLREAVQAGRVDPDKVVLSSFKRRDLLYLSEIKSPYARALIVEPRGVRWLLREDYGRCYGVSAVHMHVSLCSKARLGRLRRRGLLPVCWGARSAEQELSLVERGVQRVITDFCTDHPVKKMVAPSESAG